MLKHCPHFLYGRWHYGATIPERVRDFTGLVLQEQWFIDPAFSRKGIV